MPDINKYISDFEMLRDYEKDAHLASIAYQALSVLVSDNSLKKKFLKYSALASESAEKFGKKALEIRP
ncbi:hypothetical protein MFMK1_003133 [Metallumcola ferriviriculae]|uniref:Uncharacterized protein n=1 Tax=Metallumcola ferriviriculae TaxID=3039180 RepID=A0AAU0UQA1_9FIRM|nr:hypothetical protein MFMK1_003133 [Desulfitibacteraceae bacterium MK1]